MGTQQTGFDMDKIVPSATAKPGFVRIVYEGHIDWKETTEELRSKLNAPADPPWMVGTLEDVLKASGTLQRIQEIEQQMKDRGYSIPDGYIVNINAPMYKIENKVLNEVLGSEIVDGAVISISGRLSGRVFEKGTG